LLKMSRRGKAAGVVALCLAACGRFAVDAVPEVDAGRPEAGLQSEMDAVSDQVVLVEASADVENEADVLDATPDVPDVSCAARGEDCTTKGCCAELLVRCLSTNKCGTCTAFGARCSATADCCNEVNGATCGGPAIARRCCWQPAHGCDTAEDCCSGKCLNGKCQ
jgi:hypothetical protein